MRGTTQTVPDRTSDGNRGTATGRPHPDRRRTWVTGIVLVAIGLVLMAAAAVVSRHTRGAVPAPGSVAAVAAAGTEDPLIAEVSGRLAVPAAEPLLVGSGGANGKWWVLSVSVDGRCLALTDENGSDRSCTNAAGRLIGIRRSFGRLLVFGRVPGDTVAMEIGTLRNDRIDDGVVFPAPTGVDPQHRYLEHRYFVGSIDGYRDGVVPSGSVWALGTRDLIQVEDEISLPLPGWAERPTTRVVAIVASGNGAPAGPAVRFPVAPIGRWQVAIFREGGTRRLCLGVVGGQSVCGLFGHPVETWEAVLGRPTGSFDSVPPAGLTILGRAMNGGGGPYENWYAIGVISDPVVAVRATFQDEPSSPVHLYELPGRYGGTLTVFAIECACPTSTGLEGLDASGRVVARAEV